MIGEHAPKVSRPANGTTVDALVSLNLELRRPCSPLTRWRSVC